MFQHTRTLLGAVACLALAACGGGGSGTSTASSGSGPSVKIINGVEVSQADMPQYVKVFKQDSEGAWSGCTGTMIASRAVLTAAHCVDGAQIVAVQTDGNDGPLFYAEQWFVGAEYGTSEDVSHADIAVVITALPVGRPTLPLLASRMPEPGEQILVVGFGVDDAESGEFGTLRAGLMTVADVTDEHVIVEYDGESSNVCFGDSGGPAVYFIKDGEQIVAAGIAGVVSAGTDPLCEPGDVTYYTNVQPFIDAILAIVPETGLI